MFAESHLVCKEEAGTGTIEGQEVNWRVFAPRFGWSPRLFGEAQFKLLRGEHNPYIGRE